MIEQTRREYLLHRIRQNSVAMPSGCIEWQRTKNHKGYGMIHFAKAMGEGWNASTTAHRAHYQAHYNIILERDQVVCHTCDNPSCVNIKHLFIGSHADNVRDMLAKGRNAKQYKPHKRLRKYTDEQIKQVRDCAGDWGRLAHSMGMSWNYAWRIRSGQRKQMV